MLDTFMDKGVQLGLFEIKALKDLEGSCASSASTDVIDYDLVKEKIYKDMNSGGIKFNQPKSCDALKILPEENRLDFIEIKGIKFFCDNLKERRKCNPEREMDRAVKKFDLNTKIVQSLDLFKLLLQIEGFEIKNGDKKAILKDVRKNYLIVIDEEVEKDYAMVFGAQMDFLSKTSNYNDQMVIKLKSAVEGIDVVGVSKPILLCHSDVDAYYQSITRIAN
ncbi:hypothetical protein CN264_19045 [Bacillus cereus]|uniref:hypothetical protein n=1 Tax=Bacillus cereus TaxID=1396 RepID=UPI000BF68C93|nr:hypothetical protein [Bacillus cereus]PFC23506.1 hypothetical protein CN264_19045 [Bacillus cereus]